MAGAYTLARNGHVRGDISYRGWSVRRQALVDLVLYVAFFLPGIIAIAAALMLLQGITEMIRAVQAPSTGAWAARLSDVEETETRLARESQL